MGDTSHSSVDDKGVAGRGDEFIRNLSSELPSCMTFFFFKGCPYISVGISTPCGPAASTGIILE